MARGKIGISGTLSLSVMIAVGCGSLPQGGQATPSDGSAQVSAPSEGSGGSSPGTSTAPSASGIGLTAIDPELASLLIGRAEADQWLASQLTGTRWAAVEVVDPQDGKTGPIATFYDYTNSRALKVVFSVDQTTIVDRVTATGQPNLSPNEMAEAGSIATSDPGVITQMAGINYVVNNVTKASAGACGAHRCAAVFLTPPNGDYAKLILAIVDLSLSKVVQPANG
jgi:hypothetical protein